MNSKDTRRLIKAISTKNLQGNWFRAFLIFIIVYLASSFILGLFPLNYPTPEQMMAASETGDMLALLKLFLPAEITKKMIAAIGVVFLLDLIVICPMNIGMCRFFLRVAAGQKGEMADFFSVFCNLKLVFSSIVLDIIIAAATLAVNIALNIIPAVLVAIAYFVYSPPLLNLAYLLWFAASIFAFLWCSRYTFARFILAEGKHGAFKSFGVCLGLCKGRGKELMALRASYLLWDIAKIFPIFAYIYQTLFGATYARYLYHIRGDIKFVRREAAETVETEAAKEEAGSEDAE